MFYDRFKANISLLESAKQVENDLKMHKFDPDDALKLCNKRTEYKVTGLIEDARKKAENIQNLDKDQLFELGIEIENLKCIQGFELSK